MLIKEWLKDSLLDFQRILCQQNKVKNPNSFSILWLDTN